MTLWVIRILFLSLCTLAGYEVSQVRPELISGANGGLWGMMAGFGFGGLLIAIDEMVKLLHEQDLETLGLTYKTLFRRIAEPREDVQRAEELVRHHFTGEVTVG